MQIKSAIFLMLPLLLISCMTNPRIENISSAQRSKLNKIEVHKADIDRPYEIIGEVDGLSCNRNKYQAQDVSYDEALQGVKLKAVMLGADAVINTFCQKNSDTDWTNNCWASVKCIGDAIQYK